LLAYVYKKPAAAPILKEITRPPLPHQVPHEQISQLLQECDSLIDYDRLGEPEMNALLTLSMLASQALEQREAALSVEYWEGAYFDSQVFIAPGVDLLADLIEIDNAEGEP
jgi:hypothetical protein